MMYKIERLFPILFFCLTSAVWGATNYVSFSGSHTPPFTSWATAATDIQSAIDVASNGDTVLVTNGTYSTGGVAVHGINRIAINKPITVRSVNGSAFTVIEGQGPLGSNAVRCAYVMSGAELIGFTLTNGFTKNVYVSPEYLGGGVWCGQNAVISNCFIVGNRAFDSGRGVFQGILKHCSLVGNQALQDGAMFLAVVENCIVYSNLATYGGGTYAGSIRNSIISDNSASIFGGGMYGSSAENCSITKNTAPNGGGTYSSTVINSIVYYNSPNQWAGSGTYQNSCTTPEPSGANNGGNNTTNPPQFFDSLAGDYRLLSTSPCIDTGSNQTWMINAADVEGTPRIINGFVDMGAYEYAYEVNDTPPQANAYQQNQTHTFYVPGDEDWIKFFGTSNHTYNVQLTHQSTNIDTVLEIYRENRDGSFPTLVSQTNAFGVESGEVAQVYVLTNNIHYAHVTQSVTNAPLNQVYSLNISEQNSPADLDFIRAVNWLTFTNMPTGTTLLMDSNVIYTFNQSIDLATNLPPGVHQFEVQGPTGYESLKDPNVPGQVQNIYNLALGNPRSINIAPNQTTFLDFYFEPYFTVTGKIKDAWVGALSTNVGLSWQATNGHSQFTSNFMTRYPYHVNWADPWLTDLDGSFPFNLSLLTLNYDLPLSVGGYEPVVFTNILMNSTPGSTVDVGTLTLRPLDLNGNNIADSWEDFYFGTGSNVNPTADADGDRSSHWEECIALPEPIR
ncbi:MAG: hypothetical protein GKR87_07475 [Kiritimatiellae bacterium]|nr:hypothetical protein [Kiritimatiellia bacterium]